MWPLADKAPSEIVQRYLAVGVVVSLLIHLSGLAALKGQFNLAASPAPMTIDIQFVAPTELQIVTPPDRSDKGVPPPETRLRSDRDFRAEREQIKRGAEDSGAVVGTGGTPSAERDSREARQSAVPPPQAPQEKAVSKRAQVNRAKETAAELGSKLALRNLTLPADRVAQEFGSESASDASKPAPRAEGYRPFSRPSGSGAAFIGRLGSADLLPSLPDGDITLLNAKADQFAVFVRRVATRVFSELRLQGWESVSRGEILALQQMNTVRAVLSIKGEQISVALEGESGSDRFDAIVVEAVRRAAIDPNPPPAAATSDGTIVFLFRARSWSQIGTSRNGAPVERRWLLLATGLE